MAELFRVDSGRKTIIGMIHLEPLPGTPYHVYGTFEQTLRTAVASAIALREGGADGCLLQTVERVYTTADEADPARVAAITLITRAVVEATAGSPLFHVGVQLMRNAVSASFAVAKVAGGTFVRAGALVGMTLTPQGMVAPRPLEIAEYRRKIEAVDIDLVADVASMHYTWFGGDRTAPDVARAARDAGADAVALGDPDEQETVRLIAAVRSSAPALPIILAGHTNHANVTRVLARADGAFVGTCLEADGWGSRIAPSYVRTYVEAARTTEDR